MQFICPMCKGTGLARDGKSIICSLCDGDKVINMQPAPVEILVRYHNDDLERLEKIDKGDWIDLRAAEDVILEKGQRCLIPLGVSMQLPENFEAHVVPRSSTFKNFALIQTNSTGIIDESYCGNDDQWMMPVYAFADGRIEKNDRICQFRIVQKMPAVNFIETSYLDNKNRQGLGSTGIK